MARSGARGFNPLQLPTKPTVLKVAVLSLAGGVLLLAFASLLSVENTASYKADVLAFVKRCQVTIPPGQALFFSLLYKIQHEVAAGLFAIDDRLGNTVPNEGLNELDLPLLVTHPKAKLVKILLSSELRRC